LSARSAKLNFLLKHPCLGHLSPVQRRMVQATLKRVSRRRPAIFRECFHQSHCTIIAYTLALESAGRIQIVEGRLTGSDGLLPEDNFDFAHFWNQIDGVDFDMTWGCCEWSMLARHPLNFGDGGPARQPVDRQVSIWKLDLIYKPYHHRTIRVWVDPKNFAKVFSQIHDLR